MGPRFLASMPVQLVLPNPELGCPRKGLREREEKQLGASEWRCLWDIQQMSGR